MSFFVAYAPCYVHAVPDNHRFPMEKYSLIYQQLIYEGLMDEREFLIPSQIAVEHILKVHTESYFQKLECLQCTPREQRISGFVHSKELIQREMTIMEGTRLCAEKVVNGGVALNIAGGTHHAYSDRGEGFCLLNDQAIAATWLLDNKLTERVLIVDLDVHQGNGTAEIFQSNPNVFTFSMHGASNYPLKKEQSDCDIALPDNTTDKTYLSLLNQNLQRIFNEFNPTFLFYQCGVDVLSSDKLGKLELSMKGCKERDELVFRFAKSNNLPVVCSMGGGYSPEIRHIVDAHMQTFRVAQQFFD